MLRKKFLGEFIGTALLVATVVGSGAMAQFLTQDIGVQLLINTVATIFMLALLIYVFAGISGSHFNPLVSLAEFFFKRLSGQELLAYVIAQFAGGVLGTVIANTMFGRQAIVASEFVRSGRGIWLGEIVATAGLLMLIHLLRSQKKGDAAPLVVAGWIGAAYFFTASTSFANPAVTFARAWTDTFSGIAPQSVPLFIVFQTAGAILGVAIASAFVTKEETQEATDE
ncbi:GlpF Glycerol uptake facilitator and related permeases (Major Intrinsic Protein Family) [Candidatus Nanopelagicaceae bacterium]